MTSITSTPKLYTSLLSFSIPVLAYSGATYLQCSKRDRPIANNNELEQHTFPAKTEETNTTLTRTFP